MHLVEGPLGVDSIAQLLSLKWFWLMVENILGIQILHGNKKKMIAEINFTKLFRYA